MLATALRRQLQDEGRRLADRLEREERRMTPSERRRADEILAELEGLTPRPAIAAPASGPAFHRMCGGALIRELPMLATCARCGAVQLGLGR
jgi:hypothetical protein